MNRVLDDGKSKSGGKKTKNGATGNDDDENFRRCWYGAERRARASGLVQCLARTRKIFHSEDLMAEIQPFRAFRYDTEKVALEKVLTQPYDKINAKMQEKYYAASPFNLIPIEKGRTLPEDTAANNVYTRAGAKVEEWIKEKVLVQDAAPSIYIYSQEYLVPGTQTKKTRMGFIALGRVEDYDAKVVFRHEKTLSGPKADRIELLKHTHMQTGQLFLLYNDAPGRVDTILEEVARKQKPLEMTDEYGVVHRIWPVSDIAFIKRVQIAMAEKKILIADGHHRYETAINSRNEAREKAGKTDLYAPEEFAMMTFVNTHSKGLTILPTHRLIKNVANFDFEKFRQGVARTFDWYGYPYTNAEEREAAYAEFRKDFESGKHKRRAIGVYAGKDAFYLFLLRRDADLELLLPDVSEAQRGLDIVLLHRLLIEKGLGITTEAVTKESNLDYIREMDGAIEAVDKGEAQLAFLLNPVGVQQVADIALGGDVMPQKSTDFYPKLLSGVAIYNVDGERVVGEKTAGA
jgi:uncharacterized protein (DUF1015 family)